MKKNNLSCPISFCNDVVTNDSLDIQPLLSVLLASNGSTPSIALNSSMDNIKLCLDEKNMLFKLVVQQMAIYTPEDTKPYPEVLYNSIP